MRAIRNAVRRFRPEDRGGATAGVKTGEGGGVRFGRHAIEWRYE